VSVKKRKVNVKSECKEEKSEVNAKNSFKNF